MKRFFLYALLFASVPCTAQTVNIFESGMNEGVTYSLPDTQLDITVEAECITRTPGEFCRYAERFLRISDAITDESIGQEQRNTQQQKDLYRSTWRQPDKQPRPYRQGHPKRHQPQAC